MELSDSSHSAQARHPIAVFVITVLTVIGIGVGVVAADHLAGVRTARGTVHGHSSLVGCTSST